MRIASFLEPFPIILAVFYVSRLLKTTVDLTYKSFKAESFISRIVWIKTRREIVEMPTLFACTLAFLSCRHFFLITRKSRNGAYKSYFGKLNGNSRNNSPM